MLPLRFPWIWWTLGWLLVIGVSISSLLPSDLLPDISTRDKLVHASVYCLLMLWFSGLYRRQRHWIIALLLFGLGFALDAAQQASPSRQFDLADVAANAGGIILGLLLARFVFEGWCRRVEQLLFS